MASRVWKDGTRRGIAYVEDRETAERIMQAVGRTFTIAPLRTGGRPAIDQETLLLGAMAVYSDRKGRPFAWQIPFEIGRWEQVIAVVGEVR